MEEDRHTLLRTQHATPHEQGTRQGTQHATPTRLAPWQTRQSRRVRRLAVGGDACVPACSLEPSSLAGARKLESIPCASNAHPSQWLTTPTHMHPDVFALEQLRGKHLLRGMQPDSTRDARPPLPSPSTLQGQRLACAALCLSSPWLLPVEPPLPAPSRTPHLASRFSPSATCWTLLSLFGLLLSSGSPACLTLTLQCGGHVITDDGASRSGVRRVP